MHHDIQLFAEYAVTPFVGVWIETQWVNPNETFKMSHPSWVCGLKQSSEYGLDLGKLSHPSWVCGLKLLQVVNLHHRLVSHPSWVCGLKLVIGRQKWEYILSHPSWVCGLKLLVVCINPKLHCHTLRGCVD